jgi:prepilin-type N-terminal cleavage/methylation domain-containing protein
MRIAILRACRKIRGISFGQNAFTLIELLIVVAIIAILAALAVPNFLEAHVRSKVSRAKADLRSIAGAIEIYRLDQSRYPTMLEPGFTGGVPPLSGSDLKWWYIPDSLSTPVSYLSTSHILCPFGGDHPRRSDFPDEIWRRYSYENIPELEQKYLDGFSILQYKYAPDQDASVKWGFWRILCIGPDNAWNPMIPYDPTNGTVSTGNIMRTQRESEVLQER